MRLTRSMFVIALVALVPTLAAAEEAPASSQPAVSTAATEIAPASQPAPAAAADETPPAPMLGSRDGVWGAIKLQYRARPELRYNADLDAEAQDTLLFGLQRARLGAALNYQDWVEAFVQVQDARRAGFANSTVGYTGNTDLHRAYVQLKLKDADISLKLGRQRLVYGDQRLIGHLEWSNQGRVFEAAKLKWSHGLGDLDLFAAVFTTRANGNLLDATHFFGLYDSMRAPRPRPRSAAGGAGAPVRHPGHAAALQELRRRRRARGRLPDRLPQRRGPGPTERLRPPRRCPL